MHPWRHVIGRPVHLARTKSGSVPKKRVKLSQKTDQLRQLFLPDTLWIDYNSAPTKQCLYLGTSPNVVYYCYWSSSLLCCLFFFGLPELVDLCCIVLLSSRASLGDRAVFPPGLSLHILDPKSILSLFPAVLSLSPLEIEIA